MRMRKVKAKIEKQANLALNSETDSKKGGR